MHYFRVQLVIDQTWSTPFEPPTTYLILIQNSHNLLILIKQPLANIPIWQLESFLPTPLHNRYKALHWVKKYKNRVVRQPPTQTALNTTKPFLPSQPHSTIPKHNKFKLIFFTPSFLLMSIVVVIIFGFGRGSRGPNRGPLHRGGNLCPQHCAHHAGNHSATIVDGKSGTLGGKGHVQ
jgi:hypothetical protein